MDIKIRLLTGLVLRTLSELLVQSALCVMEFSIRVFVVDLTDGYVKDLASSSNVSANVMRTTFTGVEL